VNLSGFVVFLIVASLIGRIVKSTQQAQAKRNAQSGQKPAIPYAQNQPQQVSVHESAAKPKLWNGGSLQEMINRLEQAAAEQQNRKDPAVNFSQAFEGVAPIPKKSAPPGEGIASTEGTLSRQGFGSAEGTVSTQGFGSMEGTGSTQGMTPAPTFGAAKLNAPAAPRRISNGYLSNTADLKRAIIMSEVLGKPVSLRSKRAL
jgi:hypothetical protein